MSHTPAARHKSFMLHFETLPPAFSHSRATGLCFCTYHSEALVCDDRKSGGPHVQVCGASLWRHKMAHLSELLLQVRRCLRTRGPPTHGFSRERNGARENIIPFVVRRRRLARNARELPPEASRRPSGKIAGTHLCYRPPRGRPLAPCSLRIPLNASAEPCRIRRRTPRTRREYRNCRERKGGERKSSSGFG